MHAALGGGANPRARIFTFLRDPVDRAFSAFQYGHQRGRDMPPFEEWATGHANFLCRMLTGVPRREATAAQAIDVLQQRVGFVGLLREFDLSLVMLRRWLDLPRFDIGYRSRNQARSNRMRLELKLDSANVELVRSLNAEDLLLYEHAVGSVFEAQKRAYGAELTADLEAFRQRQARRRPSLPRPSRLWSFARRGLVFRPAWKKHLREREEREG